MCRDSSCFATLFYRHTTINKIPAKKHNSYVIRIAIINQGLVLAKVAMHIRCKNCSYHFLFFCFWRYSPSLIITKEASPLFLLSFPLLYKGVVIVSKVLPSEEGKTPLVCFPTYGEDDTSDFSKISLLLGSD